MSTWTMVRTSVSLATAFISVTRFLQTSKRDMWGQIQSQGHTLSYFYPDVPPSSFFRLPELTNQTGFPVVPHQFLDEGWHHTDDQATGNTQQTFAFFGIRRGPAAESLRCGCKLRLIMVKCWFIPHADWNDGLVINLIIVLTIFAANFCLWGLPQQHPRAFPYKNSPLSPPFSALQDTFRSNVISASARRRSAKVLLKCCLKSTKTCSALVCPRRKQPVTMCPAWKHTHTTMLGTTMVANRLNMKGKKQRLI